MRPIVSFLRFANRRTRNSPALRRFGINAYAALVRANPFTPPPRVFMNGPAKSGTHLLSDCLSLLPRMLFSGRHFALAEFVRAPAADGSTYPGLDEAGLRRALRACGNGSFISAHAAYHPALQGLLHDGGFRHLLLLRDPRDIAVSYTHYVLREAGHHHHRYYRDVLKSDDERLMATIRGFGRDRCGDAGPLASSGERMAAYLPWLDDPSVLVSRFEDLVGERGGASAEMQVEEVRRIARFVERPLDEAQAAEVAAAMYSEKSLTFRKGSAGAWRSHFSEAHRAAFKEVANPVLLRLGYETSEDW